MYAAEVSSQLRSLNWLAQEIRRVPAGSREGALLQSQIDALRARLPVALLAHHDRLTQGGRASAAEVRGDRCGGCGARLPADRVASLGQAGNFSVCPRCGVFLWAAKTGARPRRQGTLPPAARSRHD